MHLILKFLFVLTLSITPNCAQFRNVNYTTLVLLQNGTHFIGQDKSYSQQHNRTFVPAQTYQGYGQADTYHTAAEKAKGGSVFVDATAEFINKTRSAMASGICYKEVPTSSLPLPTHIRPEIEAAAAASNGSTPNTSKLQVCCEGYERNPHIWARCEPICQDDCPNGICTAPNTCVCIPGHVRNEQDKCIATCPIGCGNGICSPQGECICKAGYTLEPLERKFCVPHCETPCQYGKCVAPNKCDCYEGYRLASGGKCQPQCQNCENGECTAPGICSCKPGYAQVNGQCEPVCERGCQKGRCIAPDTCKCDQGFELDHSGSSCLPHCDRPCLNGVCAGDNSCDCNPGYIQDELQRNICKPHCPQGCPNGYCTSPNFCICKPGFIKMGVKGHQICTKLQ